jgi:hypothetical protein
MGGSARVAPRGGGAGVWGGGAVKVLTAKRDSEGKGAPAKDD